MELAFDKEQSDNRKEWINKVLKEIREKGSIVDYTNKKVPVNHFINTELALFSIYNLERSIPNVLDGLKPTQRKILYGCMKKKLFKEKKVSELYGDISSMTHYHHGDAALQETIIKMAQEFIGSGNAQLLFPSGQFGTRRLLGDDAAHFLGIFISERLGTYCI